MNDLKFATRQLQKDPGANTAIFSVVNTLLLRSLPAWLFQRSLDKGLTVANRKRNVPPSKAGNNTNQVVVKSLDVIEFFTAASAIRSDLQKRPAIITVIIGKDAISYRVTIDSGARALLT